MSNEIQGSRFASSNIGSFLWYLLPAEDLPLRPSDSVSSAKAVTEHNGKFAQENPLCFHFHDTAFQTDTQRSQKSNADFLNAFVITNLKTPGI